MDRRTFGKFGLAMGAGIAAGFSGFGATFSALPNSNPALLFADLNLGYLDPSQVLATFTEANTGFLMATYGVFFPNFMIKNGAAAPDLLKSALIQQGGKVRANQHRADALPAVAAAHRLSYLSDEYDIERTAQFIIDALDDPRREVREIVLQNLITGTAPNFDRNKHFKVTTPILSKVIDILLAGAEDVRMFQPSLLALEFLLNARVLYRTALNKYDQTSIVQAAIDKAKEVYADISWLHLKLIDTHEATFNEATTRPESLPPQATEALIGWRTDRMRSARDYSSVLAFARIELLRTCEYTAIGKMDATEAMTANEASVAIPKILDFIDMFEIAPLVTNSSFEPYLAEKAPDFLHYLKNDFLTLYSARKRLIEKSPGFAMETHAKELPGLVPFSQYDSRAKLSEMKRAHDEGYERAVLAGTAIGTGSAFAAFLGDEGLRRLIRWFGEKKGSKESIANSGVEEVEDFLAKQSKEIDAGAYQGVEEDQANLGDISEDDL